MIDGQQNIKNKKLIVSATGVVDKLGVGVCWDEATFIASYAVYACLSKSRSIYLTHTYWRNV
jgi:hypothetical protein